MTFLNKALTNKEEYIASIKRAIKHANLEQYKLLVKKQKTYVFRLRKTSLKRNGYEEIEEAHWDHMQFLALMSSDLLFFKYSYEFLLEIGFTPNGITHKHNNNQESVIDLLMTNIKDKKINEGSLEYLLSTRFIFDVDHNFSSYPHKVTFLACLKQSKIILETSYYNLYDKFFDTSFYKACPIYSDFTKEEIKHFNLMQTTRFSAVNQDKYWIFKKNLAELAIETSNRKSKQVKKFLFYFAFENPINIPMDDVCLFLESIKNSNDQIFYWALNLKKCSDSLADNEISLIVNQFELFNHAQNITVTQKRIEKLFNVKYENNPKDTFETNQIKLINSIQDIPDNLIRNYNDNIESTNLYDIETMFHEDNVNIVDTIKMMLKAKASNIVYNIKDFSSGAELHDFLSQEIDNINSVNHTLHQDEIAKINKRKFLDYTIAVPQTSHDLKIVGRMLNICVGTASYDIRILRKKSNVVFLMKDKKVWACVEFINGQITQMKHKNNINVKEDVQKKFAILLKALYGKGDLKFLDPANAFDVDDPDEIFF